MIIEIEKEIQRRLNIIEQLKLEYPVLYDCLPEYKQANAEISNLETIMADIKIQQGE